jgi:hypothetical protein
MPNLLADDSGYYTTAETIPGFYSDDTTLQVCVLEQNDYSTTTEPACNRIEPVKGLNTVSTPFLSKSDPVFVSFQQVGLRLDFKRSFPVPAQHSCGVGILFLISTCSFQIERLAERSLCFSKHNLLWYFLSRV